MQKSGDGNYLYSPSNLVDFLGCSHITFLDKKGISEGIKKTEQDNSAKLFQKKGMEHEQAYLESLKDQNKNIAEISKAWSLEDRVALTLDAMQSGFDVIYQAALYKEPWYGYADFLIKCDTPSELGNYSYEVLDTKLSKSAEAKYIIQLCMYSELLSDLQGIMPKNMYLFLGEGRECHFKVTEFFDYYTQTKNSFNDYVRELPSSSYPEPCTHCTICSWSDHCNSTWKNDDHLSLVANIQNSQRDKLYKAGIKTVEELALAEDNTKISNLNKDTYKRLHAQAKLQHSKKSTGKDKYEILSPELEKGFYIMPKPDIGDLFFDMEGDPLYPDGLEYLFGVYSIIDNKEDFKLFWAHDHDEEKKTFKKFMEFLEQHLKQYPDAHIYHYNHYETTALKRLACRYAIREEQLDNLLRQRKFVDLYAVVRDAIRISEPSYSIKNLEVFYMEKRVEEVATAVDSIIVYNQWRELDDASLLQKIADYNEVDCISTYKLREWLISIKPKEIGWFESDIRDDDSKDDSADDTRKQWEKEYEEYKGKLESSTNVSSELKIRLSDLLEFHNREAKPQWWGMFDRKNKHEDELIEDLECIAGLAQIASPIPDKRSYIYQYSFPEQDYKRKMGEVVKDVQTMEAAGKIVELNAEDYIINIRYGGKGGALPKHFSIGPPDPVNAAILRNAIYRCIDNIISDHTSSAITDLLTRSMPRIKGRALGEPIIRGNQELYDATLEAISNLDNSYLFIQGPPGTGKTYTSSHVIVDLIRQGKKIGITSNSHKAIHNLLKKIEVTAIEKGLDFRGIKKASKDKEETAFDGTIFENKIKTQDIDLSANAFGGTAWLFADPYFDGQLDYLFVDEAGQVSIANIVAMSSSAKNIILIGDQMQLGQPVQGTHPNDTGLSILEFLLRDKSTIPPERGILLDTTYRLNPAICDFISTAFYDKRLLSDDKTSSFKLDVKNTDLPNEGIVIIEVNHTGCSQKSAEEGSIIKEKYYELLGQKFLDKDVERQISKDDILIVTPYNVQVNYLHSILPDAKIGTVDKFQGQEAPIVLISMVTSNAEYLPRDIEFLYSSNRLNVAISRAKCLAVVVMNSALFEIPCKTIEQMKLVNTFCKLRGYVYNI